VTEDTEIIGYVPRQSIIKFLPEPSGFVRDRTADLYSLLVNQLSWGERPKLEEEPARKQLIPYVVCESPDGRLFTMQRKTKQSEQRLHNKLSVGVGGHLERTQDLEGQDDPVELGMRRELNEEIETSVDGQIEYLGLLNDDTNEVGRVHLGVVYRASVKPEETVVRETEKMEGDFWSIEQLEQESDRLESWSRIVLRSMFS
jgi:predicted NUDIX family phosphoesterase